jgi:Uma2 family endonuclease
MSTSPHSLTTWAAFQLLPQRPQTGQRYELHDGEVVIVPPPRPSHIKLQKRIEGLLEELAGGRGVVTTEFPYRPVANRQFWFADVAYVPRAAWDAMPPDKYPVYAPLLIVEVLSPSNTAAKINRQRTVAVAAGTEAFWVVDEEKRTIYVTTSEGVKFYTERDTIPLTMFGGETLDVERVFAGL